MRLFMCVHLNRSSSLKLISLTLSFLREIQMPLNEEWANIAVERRQTLLSTNKQHLLKVIKNKSFGG